MTDSAETNGEGGLSFFEHIDQEIQSTQEGSAAQFEDAKNKLRILREGIINKSDSTGDANLDGLIAIGGSKLLYPDTREKLQQGLANINKALSGHTGEPILIVENYKRIVSRSDRHADMTRYQYSILQADSVQFRYGPSAEGEPRAAAFIPTMHTHTIDDTVQSAVLSTRKLEDDIKIDTAILQTLQDGTRHNYADISIVGPGRDLGLWMFAGKDAIEQVFKRYVATRHPGYALIHDVSTQLLLNGQITSSSMPYGEKILGEIASNLKQQLASEEERVSSAESSKAEALARITMIYTQAEAAGVSLKVPGQNQSG